MSNNPGSSQPASTCSNCGESHGPDDVFCESCGYDFLAGSLPDAGLAAPTATGAAAAAKAAGVDVSAPSPAVAPAADPASTAASAPAPGAPAAATTVAVVTLSVSAEFFERMGAGDSLDFPDPVPDPVVVELRAGEALIGRRSESRGIYPEIDVSTDPAASSRHALLRHKEDGSWTLTDVGSTNGSYLGDSTDPIESNRELPLELDSPFFVGAWTEVRISEGPA